MVVLHLGLKVEWGPGERIEPIRGHRGLKPHVAFRERHLAASWGDQGCRWEPQSAVCTVIRVWPFMGHDQWLKAWAASRNPSSQAGILIKCELLGLTYQLLSCRSCVLRPHPAIHTL